jgi:hypothetical protein
MVVRGEAVKWWIGIIVAVVCVIATPVIVVDVFGGVPLTGDNTEKRTAGVLTLAGDDDGSARCTDRDDR